MFNAVSSASAGAAGHAETQRTMAIAANVPLIVLSAPVPMTLILLCAVPLRSIRFKYN